MSVSGEMCRSISTAAAELLHGEEIVVYADAGYQGNAERPEMEGKAILHL